jgi:hypothetical protein
MGEVLGTSILGIWGILGTPGNFGDTNLNFNLNLNLILLFDLMSAEDYFVILPME